MNGVFDDKLKEKLEILTGDRTGDRLEAAVRISDFSDLLELDQLQSVELTAAPTVADFNALRNDVRNMSRALNAVALAITKRKIR